MRPERVEMEIDVSGSVGRMVPEICSSPRRNLSLCSRPDDRPDIRRQFAQLLDEWKTVVLVAQRGQAAKLAADEKRVDAARGYRQARMVKHEAAEPPVSGRARRK